MAESRYEIHFTEAQAAATSLEEAITELQAQLTELGNVQTELLNENNWTGPSKTEFSQEFALYMEKLQDLYKNSTEYLAALNASIKAYSDAEH